MAPSYAILFMADLEEKLLQTSPLTPLMWWRYIDDIFLIWQHGEESLQTFINHLNTFHPTIKFTADFSYDRVNFLDVQVIKQGDKLVTDLFVKPTDTHQYLQASSCHVYHSKRAIPYSQALRLNRICSDISFLDHRCNQLESWLKQRGYNDKLVRDQIVKARKLKRDDLLDREKPATDQKLTLNITYHPAYAKLKETLHHIHLLLAPNEEHRKVFPLPPIVGFKRGKSLKDFLVRAKLPKERVVGSRKCGGTKCEVCNFVEESRTFSNSSGDSSFDIKYDLHCNSKFVVYLLKCKTCHKQYVGSTKTKFRTRLNNYRKDLRCLIEQRPKQNQKEFHEHFIQCDHFGEDDWLVTLIDHYTGEDINGLRSIELSWQHKLNTFKPNGLNDREALFEYG